MSTYNDLLAYYANLLIAQYNGKAKASAHIQQLVSGMLMGDGNGSTLPLDVLNGFNLNPTVQTITFSATPVSGSFALTYNGSSTALIPYNASLSSIQAAVNGLVGYGQVLVSGGISQNYLTLTWQNNQAPLLFSVTSNTLSAYNPVSDPNSIAVWEAFQNLSVSGSNVTSWTDQKSGIVATGPSLHQPTLSTSQLNGQPAVKLNATSPTELTMPSGQQLVPESGPWTIVVVIKNNGFSNSTYQSIFVSHLPSANETFYLEFTNDGGGGYGPGVFWGSATEYSHGGGQVFGASVTFDTSAYHVWALSYNGLGKTSAANYSFQDLGASVSVAALSGIKNTNPTVVPTIGAKDSSYGEPGDFSLAGLYVLGSSLPAGFYGYLNTTFGFSLSDSLVVNTSVTANTAIGQQLDWLGKYVGVTRRGVGANGQSIVLLDSDFLTLIRIAIASNNFGSDLYTIQAFLAQFFPGIILVFDYANTLPMQLSYFINTGTVGNNLIQLMLAEGLLPVPMAVIYSVIGAPSITNFFGVSDYYVNSGAQPANTTPLNSIGGYDLAHTATSYLWMDYSYSLKH